ncbi:MAG: hypothetical protein KGJ78_10110 [Alphaproteobacteria bacterium]|nr:hypothetical protein [Alphaproteobacteria bacterium]
MKQLPELPVELKALATATLIFAGLAILVGFLYIVVAHQGVHGYAVDVADIAALYTGPGVSVVTLVSLAHVHLLGLTALFAIVGFIFVHSTLPTGSKIFWSVLPYVAFLADVSGWFLTKLVAPGFVYLVISAGAAFIVALGSMILMSLFELWVAPLNPP